MYRTGYNYTGTANWHDNPRQTDRIITPTRVPTCIIETSTSLGYTEPEDSDDFIETVLNGLKSLVKPVQFIIVTIALCYWCSTVQTGHNTPRAPP